MRKVLKEINLTITTGEFLAIIGAFGSVKPTPMNIIGCLDIPDDHGGYYINGQNVAYLSPDEHVKIRREHSGFIFQRYQLIPDYSVQANVEILAIYVNSQREQRCQRAVLLLDRLGLKGWEGSKPKRAFWRTTATSIYRSCANQ